jgi:hypothetical protein
MIGTGRARYPEDGHDPVRSGDLDMCDEGLDEGLALGVGTGADDCVDVLGDLEERGSWRASRLMRQLSSWSRRARSCLDRALSWERLPALSRYDSRSVRPGPEPEGEVAATGL